MRSEILSLIREDEETTVSKRSRMRQYRRELRNLLLSKAKQPLACSGMAFSCLEHFVYKILMFLSNSSQ